MTKELSMSTSIRRQTISLLLIAMATCTQAQVKFFSIQKDSVAFFRGFAVSFDMAGAGMLMLSDYGQYEAALRAMTR